MVSARLNAAPSKDGNKALVASHMDAVGNNNVADGLARLAALSKAKGFDVLIAVWPRFTEAAVVDVDRDGVVAADNALTVETLAAQSGLPTLRLSKAYRQAYQHQAGRDNTPRALFAQRDGMHPSPEGATVAAEAIKRYLVAHVQWLR